MVRTVEAIYTRGVLKPLEDLPLAEEERVRLVVESVDQPAPPDRDEAFRRLVRGIESMHFRLNGSLPTRDDLHERR